MTTEWTELWLWQTDHILGNLWDIISVKLSKWWISLIGNHWCSNSLVSSNLHVYVMLHMFNISTNQLLFLWVFISCWFKLIFLEKALPYSLQTYGFSSVWILRVFNFIKPLPHVSQKWEYFFPVWTIVWTDKSWVCDNDLSQ